MALLGFLVLSLSLPHAFAATCTGIAAWSATHNYAAGEQAVYNNHLWTALVAGANIPPDYCPSCQWWRDEGVCGTSGNQAPTVSLSSPAGGATFTAGSTITVSANAADADGTVSKVEFFQGSTSLGVDTSSPYGITWSNVAAGSYTLKAVATDNAGAATTSATVSITVTTSTNQPPTATLTAPASGASFTAGSTITVSANASDPNGTVSKVEFFQGSTSIGVDTTSPYSITWSNVAAGSYTLKAVATDNAGATGTSATVSITVTGGAGCTTIPAAPANLRSPSKTDTTVDIAWDASAPISGCTIQYQIFRNSALVTTQSGTTFQDTGRTQNTTYSYFVKAVDQAGTSGQSNTLSVTTNTTPPAGAKLIGYAIEWGTYDRNYQVKNIESSGSAAKLTHINYAFGNAAGGACALGDSYADIDKFFDASMSVNGTADCWDAGCLRGNFHQLQELKAMHPGLKMIWSFGGWTWSAGFTQAAQNPAAFANSCFNLINDPRWAGLWDGIDIDWEYPNACGNQCDSSGFAAFGNVMAALRSKFGPSFLITAAVTADGAKIDLANYAAAASSVNWYNIMTYDFFGAFAPTGPTAPHSPLTSYPGIPQPNFFADAAVQKYKSIGVPASKLLLGIGFYGRGWTGVGSANGGLGQSATGPAAGRWEAGIEDYHTLKTSCPPTGSVAGTSMSLCGNNWWSFDTPGTIASKMTYKKNQGLAGAFFWELSGDTSNGELITSMYNNR
jgi:chitinase